jgi:hypothetical protein
MPTNCDVKVLELELSPELMEELDKHKSGYSSSAPTYMEYGTIEPEDRPVVINGM